MSNNNYYEYYFNLDESNELTNEESNYNPDYRYLDIEFSNGLCNKIIYISGLIRYCLEHKNTRLIEPKFMSGKSCNDWRSECSILFSEIWNIDRFNKIMEPLNFYMVPRYKIDEYNNTHDNKIITDKGGMNYANGYGYFIELEYHKKCINLQMIGIDDNIIIHVLKSLILINKYKEEVKYLINNLNYDSVHLRIESDWKSLPWGYVQEETIINNFQYSPIYDINKPIFFSTGENHEKIRQLFNNININSFTYLNDNMYDVRSAISFTLCLFSNNFISSNPFTNAGHSTFSCLLRLQRILICNNYNNFYYNENEIIKSNTPGILGLNDIKDKDLEFKLVDTLPL